jgi:hypothetical protein
MTRARLTIADVVPDGDTQNRLREIGSLEKLESACAEYNDNMRVIEDYVSRGRDVVGASGNEAAFSAFEDFAVDANLLFKRLVRDCANAYHAQAMSELRYQDEIGRLDERQRNLDKLQKDMDEDRSFAQAQRRDADLRTLEQDTDRREMRAHLEQTRDALNKTFQEKVSLDGKLKALTAETETLIQSAIEQTARNASIIAVIVGLGLAGVGFVLGSTSK